MKANHLEAVEPLFEVISKLETIDECRAFLEDLCTIPELLTLNQRWDVVKRLNGGQSYQDISAATGASTATISRVNRSFIYGVGGYRKMLERTEKTQGRTDNHEG